MIKIDELIASKSIRLFGWELRIDLLHERGEVTSGGHYCPVGQSVRAGVNRKRNGSSGDTTNPSRHEGQRSAPPAQCVREPEHVINITPAGKQALREVEGRANDAGRTGGEDEIERLRRHAGQGTSSSCYRIGHRVVHVVGCDGQCAAQREAHGARELAEGLAELEKELWNHASDLRSLTQDQRQQLHAIDDTALAVEDSARLVEVLRAEVKPGVEVA